MDNFGIEFREGGKIPPKSKDENARIAKLVCKTLSDPDYDDLTKYEIINNYVRKWTSIRTMNGMYRGVPYFTEDAYKKYVELWEKHKPNLTEFSDILGSHFTHEHILPVSAALRLFEKDRNLTVKEVKRILYNDVNAAVVTKEEADLLDKPPYKDKMPESFFDTRNIFDRYTEVGLSLLYVVWSEGMKEIIGEPKQVDLNKGVLGNHFKDHFQEEAKKANEPFKDAYPQYLKEGKEPMKTFGEVYPELQDKTGDIMEKFEDYFSRNFGGKLTSGPSQQSTEQPKPKDKKKKKGKK